MVKEKGMWQKFIFIFMALILVASMVVLVACDDEDEDEPTKTTAAPPKTTVAPPPQTTVAPPKTTVAPPPQTTVAPPPQTTAPATGAKLSANSTLGELLDNPTSKAILEKYINNLLTQYAAVLEMQRGKVFSSLMPNLAPLGVSQETIDAMTAELNALGSATPEPTTPPAGAVHTGLDANSTLGELLDNPDTKAVLEKHINNLLTQYAAVLEMQRGKVFSSLMPNLAPLGVSQETIDAMIADLAAIK